MIDAVDRYIDYNALKWFLRHKLPSALALYEPIFSPGEFNRRACLDLNETIIPIAKQNGRALWWQSDGRFRWL